MKRMLEMQAKTAEEAVKKGVEQLGLSRFDVDVKIISSGGLFRKAKVEIYYEVPDAEPVKPIAEKKQLPSEPPKAALNERKSAAALDAKTDSASRSEGAKTDFAQKRKEVPPKNASAEQKENRLEHAPEKKTDRRQANAGQTQKSPQENGVRLKAAADEVGVGSEPELHWATPPNYKPEPNLKLGFGKGRNRENNNRGGENNKNRENNNRGAENNANRENNNRGGDNNKNRENNNRGGEINRNRENNNANRDAAQNGDREHENRRRNPPRRERDTVDPTPEQVTDAVGFLTAILEKMGFAATVEHKVEDGLRMNLVTEDSRVIGHRGEVLDALQYLASLRVNQSDDQFVHVSLDGLNYRSKRQGTLENLARRKAEDAVKMGRKVSLEPMNSADRRVIHAALGENNDVITRSEGRDPMRRVVIMPKKQ